MTCPACGYVEAMHIPHGGFVCPPTTGRFHGEGAYLRDALPADDEHEAGDDREHDQHRQ